MMTEDDKRERAKDKMFFLLNKTQRFSPWSPADYDEIKLLAEYLKSEMPLGAYQLIMSDDFASQETDQEETAERIKRQMLFHADFGKSNDAADIQDEELLPRFQLTENDRARVVKLCSDMRKIVFASADFDEPHKKRLLNRVAAIEKEVLSDRGMFDVILGGVSDIGETLGKFGKDIKPLTDRMSEVTKITRAATKAYDQLPSPEEIKSLPAPDGDETD